MNAMRRSFNLEKIAAVADIQVRDINVNVSEDNKRGICQCLTKWEEYVINYEGADDAVKI